MFQPYNPNENQPDPSLDFDKEFTYIDLVHDEFSVQEKKQKLKIHSKIVDGKNVKKKSGKNNKPNILNQYKSQVTKKSLTKQKQQSKGAFHNKKNGSKSLQKLQEDKKINKTIQTKSIPIKLKTGKSLKNLHFQFNKKQNLQKKDNYFLKKKKKKNLAKNDQKNNNIKTLRVKITSNKKSKCKKCKSQTSLQKIVISEIKPLPSFLNREDKVIHQYFGMQNKLVSIIDQNKSKCKRQKSKLSKTKTQSSSNISNNSSSRNTSKFHLRAIKLKK